MIYLYHWVPKKTNGNILVPLNRMKELEPVLYSEYYKKYTGREAVTKQYIPTLNCLWNDVLHLTAVHPQDLKDALIESGDPDSINFDCYQIPASLLDLNKTTVYFSGDIPENRMNLKNFQKYNPSKIKSYSKIPEKTKKYYKDSFKNNKRPLVFHAVPHILYKGSIDATHLNRIKV